MNQNILSYVAVEGRGGGGGGNNNTFSLLNTLFYEQSNYPGGQSYTQYGAHYSIVSLYRLPMYTE